MASKTLSTALRDKAATHNRLCKAKPIPAGSEDPLNRLGHIIAWSLGMYTALAPLSFHSHLRSRGVFTSLYHKYGRLAMPH